MYALKRSVGPWSAGTRVEILGPMDKGLNDYIPGYVHVRVLVSGDHFLEVAEDDLVKLRSRSRTVEIGGEYK